MIDLLNERLKIQPPAAQKNYAMGNRPKKDPNWKENRMFKPPEKLSAWVKAWSNTLIPALSLMQSQQYNMRL